MLGHSLGGATAAAAIRADRRLQAGINLDGSLMPPLTAGTDRPFLLFGSDPGPGPEDPSWDQFWTSQYGRQRDYVRAFFDLHLRHLDNHLLRRPSPCYPQIRFLR